MPISAELQKIIQRLRDNDPELVRLKLVEKGIDDEAVQALAEALKVNTTLKFLNLSGNTFGISGEKALAEMLKVNCVLSSLNLSDNGISGGYNVLESLRSNSALKSLDLSYTTQLDLDDFELSDVPRDDEWAQYDEEITVFRIICANLTLLRLGYQGNFRNEELGESFVRHLNKLLATNRDNLFPAELFDFHGPVISMEDLQKIYRYKLIGLSLQNGGLLEIGPVISEGRYFADEAREEYKKKRFKSALANFNRAVYLGDEDIQLYIERADLKCCLGSFESAIEDYNFCLRLAPNSAVVYKKLGLVRYRTGQFLLALKDFSNSIGLESKDAEVYFYRSLVEFKLGLSIEATRDYAKARQLNPDYTESFKALKLEESVVSSTSQAKMEATPNSAQRLAAEWRTQELQEIVRRLQDNDPQLQALDLSNCDLTKNEVIAVAGALRSNSKLLKLDLSGNGIGDQEAVFLAKMLHSNKGLKELRIRNSKISYEGERRFNSLFSQNRTIEKFDFFGSLFGRGEYYLIQFNRVAGRKLKELKFNDSHLYVSDLKFPAIVTEHFGLQNGNPGQYGSERAFFMNEIGFFREVAVSRTLKELTLQNYIFRQNVCYELSSVFLTSKSLKCLDLSYTVLESFDFVIGALRANSVLEELNLSHGLITDERIDSVAQMLKVNRALKRLNLSFNSISPAGFQKLCDAMKENYSVIQLDLNDSYEDLDGESEEYHVQINAYIERNRALSPVLPEPLEPSPLRLSERTLDKSVQPAPERRREIVLPPPPLPAPAAQLVKPPAAEKPQESRPVPAVSPQDDVEDDIHARVARLEAMERFQQETLALWEARHAEIKAMTASKDAQHAQLAFERGDYSGFIASIAPMFVGREAELEHLLQTGGEDLLARHERRQILGDEVLDAYYNYFMRVMISTLRISQIARDSNAKPIVENSIEKGLRVAYDLSSSASQFGSEVKKYLDVSLPIPFVHDILHVLKTSYGFYKSRDHKREAILVVQFFHASEKPEDFIELLARKLTLAQKEHLDELANKMPGLRRAGKDLFAKMTQDDSNSEAREDEIAFRYAAREDCILFFGMIFRGELGRDNTLRNVETVFNALLSAKYKKAKIDRPIPSYVSGLEKRMQDQAARSRPGSSVAIVSSQIQVEVDRLHALVRETQSGAERISAQLGDVKANFERVMGKLQSRGGELSYAERQQLDSLRQMVKKLEKDVGSVKKHIESEQQEVNDGGEVTQAQIQKRAESHKRTQTSIKEIEKYVCDANQMASDFLVAQAEALERIDSVEDRLDRVEAKLEQRPRSGITLYSAPAASSQELDDLRRQLDAQAREVAELRRAAQQAPAKQQLALLDISISAGMKLSVLVLILAISLYSFKQAFSVQMTLKR